MPTVDESLEPTLATSPAPETDSDDAEGEALALKARHEEILETARHRFGLAREAEQDNRALFLEDLQFLSGDQWDQKVEQDRLADGRPCLVVNRLPQFVQQITNDQRQNRPSIKVHPIDDPKAVETAEIYQGIIRHIECNSDADVAYDTGAESAVRTGLGYWRILTEFSDPESFDQEIMIKQVEESASVYFDPYSKEPDGSDAEYAFVTDDISPDTYKKLYPDSEGARMSGREWSALGNNQKEWFSDGSIRICEYFCREERDATIHLLGTGEVVHDENLAERQMAAMVAKLPFQVVKSRKTKIPYICWYKLSGVEVLEETVLPGSYIPIIPVYGSKLVIDGKKILSGIVRNAKDPQRMLNFWKSAETEAITLAPKAPYIGAEGQFEGHEEEWATANRRNHSYLEYKLTTTTGQPAPGPPQRQPVEPAVQSITQASMAAADDLKNVTGIYEAGTGQQGNEVSGIALQRRANQIQTANFHFTDNLTRSIRHTGRILVEWIPVVYDTAQTIRIIGADDEQRIVKINQPTQDDAGSPITYDLKRGRYDVTVDTGPSFASKRQEAAASMLDFSRSVPQVAAYTADLIVKNMDWPGAQEFSDRIKKMLPPQLQNDGPQKDIPPQVIAQMNFLHQANQQMAQKLDDATKIIETKKLDLEHRERIEIMKLQTEAEIKMAELGQKNGVALLQAQMLEMEHRLKFLQMAQPIGAPDDFNASQADGGNYAGFGHVGGSPTGGAAPGQPMEGQP